MPATRGQKNKVDNVMHAFKEGDLKSGSGAKVKNRKQAVAIALSESGQSNRQSAKQNPERKQESAKTRVPKH